MKKLAVGLIFLAACAVSEEGSFAPSSLPSLDTKAKVQTLVAWDLTVQLTNIETYNISCITLDEEPFTFEIREIDSGNPVMLRWFSATPCTKPSHTNGFTYFSCTEKNSSLVLEWVDTFSFNLELGNEDNLGAVDWLLEGENYDFWCVYSYEVIDAISTYEWR